jgi:hypothetical protein
VEEGTNSGVVASGRNEILVGIKSHRIGSGGFEDL